MATELRMASLGPAFGREDFADNLQRLDAVEPRMVPIPVDGVATRFESWSDGDRWWAAARSADLGPVGSGAATAGPRVPRVGIGVEARRVPIEGVALLRVTDIEPFTQGRRAYLRERRGET